jgi:N-acetylglutamate synthase-like GNAT family acetyltransferase
MKSLFIRVAVADERKELEALQRRSSLKNSGDRDALLANPDAIVLPEQHILSGKVFVAERENRIVGFAAVLPREDGETELDGLFTEPELWGNGIGRSLVDHCAVYATATGSHALHVVGNPHAKGFYEACGFEMFGECSTRFGVGLLMRKTLRSMTAPGRSAAICL